MSASAHNWVRYWKSEKMEGFTMPGEYIEIRSSYLSGADLGKILEQGFQVESIQSQKINADSYCDILLKRKLA